MWNHSSQAGIEHLIRQVGECVEVSDGGEIRLENFGCLQFIADSWASSFIPGIHEQANTEQLKERTPCVLHTTADDGYFLVLSSLGGDVLLTRRLAVHGENI